MAQSGEPDPQQGQGGWPQQPEQPWQSPPPYGTAPLPMPEQPVSGQPVPGQYAGPPLEAEQWSQPGWPVPANAGPPPPPYGAGVAPYGYGPQLSFALPPGTELASTGRRIGGYFMEVLLLLVTLVIGYFIWTLVVWGRGQSPGKQVLGMYCYRPSAGRPAGWGYMLLRWFGQILESFIPFGFVITSIMMIVSNEHKAIHDHIAGTVVLHRTS
jgi:uncharacterized RDD family membrane protein YckC